MVIQDINIFNIRKLRYEYGLYLRNWKFIESLLSSLVLFATSLLINFYAGIYALESASNSVADIILSNIRVFDVDFIFVYGSVVLWIFVIYFLLLEPRRIPFTLKSMGLFILVRSLFVSLTHIGPFPSHIIITPSIFLKDFTTGGDLFFSGHTGLPFLLALIFWDSVYLRLIFMVSSFVFGVVVLLGHLHYSIDVFAAFFITYTIYHIAEIFFAKDKKIFKLGIQT